MTNAPKSTIPALRRRARWLKPELMVGVRQLRGSGGHDCSIDRGCVGATPEIAPSGRHAPLRLSEALPLDLHQRRRAILVDGGEELVHDSRRSSVMPSMVLSCSPSLSRIRIFARFAASPFAAARSVLSTSSVCASVFSTECSLPLLSSSTRLTVRRRVILVGRRPKSHFQALNHRRDDIGPRHHGPYLVVGVSPGGQRCRQFWLNHLP